jgi:hypothetical protein
VECGHRVKAATLAVTPTTVEGMLLTVVGFTGVVSMGRRSFRDSVHRRGAEDAKRR